MRARGRRRCCHRDHWGRGQGGSRGRTCKGGCGGAKCCLLLLAGLFPRSITGSHWYRSLCTSGAAPVAAACRRARLRDLCAPTRPVDARPVRSGIGRSGCAGAGGSARRISCHLDDRCRGKRCQDRGPRRGPCGPGSETVGLFARPAQCLSWDARANVHGRAFALSLPPVCPRFFATLRSFLKKRR